MNGYSERWPGQGFPAVKNLIIINVLVFAAEILLPHQTAARLIDGGALTFWAGGGFRIWQPLTYMFLHSPVQYTHILFNMLALFMFGRVLEYEFGSRRFLVYYLVCGVGAGLIQLGVNWMEFASALSRGASPAELYAWANASTIGASGAVFGLLLAYGVLHPNDRIMLLFPPVAMRAKWFVIIYGVIELLAGINPMSSGVAHFAHLGGMLFGWLLLVHWRRKRVIYF